MAFNGLRGTLSADLSSDMVVHFVRVHFIDCKGRYCSDSTPVHSEREVLTRQLALGSCEGRIMRRQGREPNSFVQALPGSSTRLLNPGCSPLSDFLIHGKSDLHVVCEPVLIREDYTECRSIFDSLTRPLGLMRLIRS